MNDDDDNFDIDAISAQIASDLGYGGTGAGAGDGGSGSPPVITPAPAPTPPAVPAPGAPAPIDPALQVAPDIPLPKSWKKDSEPVWGQMSREARDLVTKREADISRGIQMYQQGYTHWDTLTKPFAPLLQQHPGVNPVQLFQSLLQNHLTLLTGTTEQKQALAQQLVQTYQLGQYLGQPSAPAAAQLPPEFLARFNALETTFRDMTTAEQKKAVDSFFADPKNEHAVDVAPDIARLLQTGTATSLEDAYQQALWLNPGVREKMIAKQVAEQQQAATEEAKRQADLKRLNRNGSPGAKSPSATGKGSIDDTIDAVVTKHFPRNSH